MEAGCEFAPVKLFLLLLTWAMQSGQLTVVDLSCPCVTAEIACALFNICLGLFLEQETSLGRVVALDEAHKYMNDSLESDEFTETLLSTIRLQRHLGARVVISTQEPTISPRLLDLCSITIVHKFTSPNWFHALRGHLAGAFNHEVDGQDQKQTSVGPKATLHRYRSISPSELFPTVVNLRTGEALLFSPGAVVATAGNGTSWQAVYLGTGIMKVRVRHRVTADGGRSVMAG